MAVTLSDRAQLAADPTFQGQVRMAALSYATTAILKAPAVGKGNKADEKAWALAAQVLLDGGASNIVRFAYDLASASGFTFTAGTPPTATDATVIAAIPSAWPFWAGVTAADANS